MGLLWACHFPRRLLFVAIARQRAPQFPWYTSYAFSCVCRYDSCWPQVCAQPLFFWRSLHACERRLRFSLACGRVRTGLCPLRNSRNTVSRTTVYYFMVVWRLLSKENSGGMIHGPALDRVRAREDDARTQVQMPSIK